MGFTKDIANKELMKRIGVPRAELKRALGKPVLVDLDKNAVLVAYPGTPDHSFYPPPISFVFFIKGCTFNISHSLGMNDSGEQIDILSIEFDDFCAGGNRSQIIQLCKSAIEMYIGDSWFGNPYRVTVKDIKWEKENANIPPNAIETASIQLYLIIFIFIALMFGLEKLV